MQPDWGDVAAWAALAVSVGALVISARGQRRANRAADRSAAAADRSAIASEEAVAIQLRQEAAAAVAAAPKVQLVVEYVSGNLYRLRNVGKLAAKAVTADLTGLDEFADELPEGVDLGPGETFRMMLAGSLVHDVPDELPLRWDGQQDWVRIPMP